MPSLLTVAVPSDFPYVKISIFSLLVSVALYIVYQRFFHPLASYPGPFWASITDLWQVSEFLSLNQPYHLTELHAKYGPFVRYGPDKLSVTAEEAVALIYQRGGRNLPKTEFYDAYGAKIPNVFGMRDENVSLIKESSISEIRTLIIHVKATLYSQTTHVPQLLHVIHQRSGTIPRQKH